MALRANMTERDPTCVGAMARERPSMSGTMTPNDASVFDAANNCVIMPSLNVSALLSILSNPSTDATPTNARSQSAAVPMKSRPIRL